MMVGQSRMVEGRRRSKTGQLLELIDKKHGEDWLIPAAWTPYRSGIDADRWYSSIHLHSNKFSVQQDCQLLLTASTLQNRIIVYR